MFFSDHPQGEYEEVPKTQAFRCARCVVVVCFSLSYAWGGRCFEARFPPDGAIDHHIALAFQVDRLRLVEVEAFLQAPVGGFVHLDHSRNAFAGDPAGDIDGISPEVVARMFHKPAA